MVILPAIDLKGGVCVRLRQGRAEDVTTYNSNPSQQARDWREQGGEELHVVDLDGAKSASPQNLKTLERMAVGAAVEIEWGGGLKSEEALRAIFDYGATYAIVGSVAAQRRESFAEWLQMFGGDKMILGADVRNGKVSVNGWLEDLAISIEELIDGFLPYGLNQVICTDITKDGMLEGPSFGLYTDLQSRYESVDFTVSGGIASMADIERAEELKLRKVIVGKAIYENRITLKEIEQWLLNA
jgi:phosphoribosylformimino-5-aminoimidazole carboxamide ribotide isomerase